MASPSRGGKLPLRHGPAEGDEGLRKNLETAAEMRERVRDDFFLAYDCWMSLDLDYALRLADGLHPYRFKWIEECLPPDDYWGYAELRRRAPPGLLVTTGEHRHYVPLLRRSKELQFLKEQFAGRALHVEPETYPARVAALCAGKS